MKSVVGIKFRIRIRVRGVKCFVIFDEGVALKGAWNKIKIEMDNNLRWNTKGNKYDFSGKSFKKWKKTEPFNYCQS